MENTDSERATREQNKRNMYVETFKASQDKVLRFSYRCPQTSLSPSLFYPVHYLYFNFASQTFSQFNYLGTIISTVKKEKLPRCTMNSRIYATRPQPLSTIPITISRSPVQPRDEFSAMNFSRQCTRFAKCKQEANNSTGAFRPRKLKHRFHPPCSGKQHTLVLSFPQPWKKTEGETLGSRPTPSRFAQRRNNARPRGMLLAARWLRCIREYVSPQREISRLRRNLIPVGVEDFLGVFIERVQTRVHVCTHMRVRVFARRERSLVDKATRAQGSKEETLERDSSSISSGWMRIICFRQSAEKNGQSWINFICTCASALRRRTKLEKEVRVLTHRV